MSFLWRALKTQLLWMQLKKYKATKVETSTIAKTKKILGVEKREGRVKRLYLALQTEGTPENVVWMGCKGFTGGVIMSWMVFLFCIVGFRMALDTATWFSTSLATCLSLGLAFSSIVRCYVLMVLPQLFSKRGRQALAAYAFLLALGGPARNSLHNLGVLTSSLACGQEQVKRSMRQVVEMVREPLRALTATLKSLVKDIAKVVQPIRDVVVRLMRVFTVVFRVIESVTSWLGSIVSVCNKKTGTPYQRCVRSLDDAIADCQVKLGVMQFLCSLVSAVKQLCLAVKVVDALCGLMDVISDAIVGAAKRKLAAFRQHVVDMLSVSIEMNHSVDMNTTASRSVQDVVSAIVSEIESRTQTIRALIGWAILLPGLAFLLLVLKVFYYRHKFLTSDRYDNRYITRRIVTLDLARIRRNLPTALPLELRERKFYTTVTALRLVGGERRRVMSAFFFLALTTVQICSYLLCDHSIYWTLLLIRKQGLNSAVSAELPSTGVDVQGHGALAALYQELGGAFKPPSPNLDLNPVPCLPEPAAPDKGRYLQIAALLATSWLLALTEPYGLRLRNVVMSHYYPARAQQRAVWLHNHILLARGYFAVFAREQLKRRLRRTSDSGGQTASVWQQLVHRNAVLQKVFGGAVKACAVCATSEGKQASRALTPCPAPDCKARYCSFCLPSLRHCILCYEPMFDEEGEMSEAKDSSDEDINENGLYSEQELTDEEYSSNTRERDEEEGWSTCTNYRELPRNSQIYHQENSENWDESDSDDEES